MKKLLSLLAASLFLLSGTSAFAGPQDFTLINASASYICYVYVSPASSNDWEEDVLGSDECMGPGESMLISFSGGNTAVWDLRVEDVDGNYEDYRGFNLNQISTIQINGGGQASYR